MNLSDLLWFGAEGSRCMPSMVFGQVSSQTLVPGKQRCTLGRSHELHAQPGALRIVKGMLCDTSPHQTAFDANIDFSALPRR